MINLLNPDGTYNENAGKYAGLDRIVRAQAGRRGPEGARTCSSGSTRTWSGSITRTGARRRSSRICRTSGSCGWATTPDGSPGFAQQAMDAVTSGRVKIHPERYAKSYLDWLGEKRDWCISRQLWWGHRIPDLALRHLHRGRSRNAPSPAAPTWPGARRKSGGWLVCAETDLRGDELGPGHRPGSRPRRARHLVQLGLVAALDPGLAGGDARAARSTIRPACSRRPATSSRSGSRGW